MEWFKITSRRWWTTGIPYIDILYLPYTLMTVCYVLIGALLAPVQRYDILVIMLIAWFIAVGVVAHAIDERKGHPLNTGIDDKTLKLMAIIGLMFCGGVAIYLTLFYHWTALPSFAFLGFLLISYNAELFKGRFHRDMVFTLGFATAPMFFGYFAMAIAIPDLASLFIIAGLSATASIETVVNHFVKFNSENYQTAYDKDFAYLQRAVWAAVFIVYMVAIGFLIQKIG